VSKPLGVLIITIRDMGTDVWIFTQLLIVVTASFMFACSALQTAGMYASPDEEDPWSPFSTNGNFWAPLWLMFGHIPLNSYNGVSAVVGWVYSFVQCIGMVNLLVAMFADTYNRVQATSAVEYNFLKCHRMFLHRDVLKSVPPPINFPIVLFELSSLVAKRLSKRKQERKLDRKATLSPAGAHPSKPSAVGSTSSSKRHTSMLKSEKSHIGRHDSFKTDEFDDAVSKNVYDGKTFVESFIKSLDKTAPDEPQDIALSIVHGFQHAQTHFDEETDETREMVRELTMQVAEVRKTLAAVQRKLEDTSDLATPAIEVEGVKLRPLRDTSRALA